MYETASEARSRTLASAVDASATSKQAVDRTKRILESTEAEGDDYNQISYDVQLYWREQSSPASQLTERSNDVIAKHRYDQVGYEAADKGTKRSWEDHPGKNPAGQKRVISCHL